MSGKVQFSKAIKHGVRKQRFYVTRKWRLFRTGVTIISPDLTKQVYLYWWSTLA
jgi:hypothetical protein